MGKEKCHKGKDPKGCTPKQIEECHGDAKKHTCEDQKVGKKTLTSK